MEMNRYVLSECLEKIGMPIIAQDARKQENGNILQNYVNIVYFKALKQKRHDIIDRLEIAGLIYGF